MVSIERIKQKKENKMYYHLKKYFENFEDENTYLEEGLERWRDNRHQTKKYMRR